MRTISFILDFIGIGVLLGLSVICVIGIYFFVKSNDKKDGI